MILRPELHVWMPREERLSRHLSLLGVLLDLEDGAGEDEVSAARVLLVVVVLLAVVALRGGVDEKYTETDRGLVLPEPWSW